MIQTFNSTSSNGGYRVFASLFIPILLLIASISRADVVSPPPNDCPEGTRGTTSHSGPKCEAKTCDGASSCDGDLSCRAVDYCVESDEFVSSLDTRIIVRAFCSKNKSCTRGACRTLQVCVSNRFIQDAGMVPADTGTLKPTDASSSKPTQSDTGQNGFGDQGNTTDQPPEDASSEKRKISTYGCGCVVGKRSSMDSHIGIAFLIILMGWRLKRRC